MEESVESVLRQVAELSEEEKLLFYMKLPSEFEDSTSETEKDPPSSVSRRSRAAVSWLQNKCQEEKNASVQKQDLYDRYLEDCEDVGQLHISSTHFGKIVKIVFPSVHHRRLGQRGQSKYSYYGLKLKDDNDQMSLSDAFNSYKDIQAFHPSLDSSEVYPVSCQLVCEWASQLLDKPFPDIKSLSEYLISIGFSCGKTVAKFHLLSGSTSPPKMATDKKNLSSRLVQRRLQHNEIIRQHKEKLKQQLQRQREQRDADLQGSKTMRTTGHPSELSNAKNDVNIVQRPMSVQPFTSPVSGVTTSKSIWYMPVPTSVEQHSVECSALLASLTKRCHSTSVVEKRSETPGTLYNGNMSSNSQHFFQNFDSINKSKSGVESTMQSEPVLGQDSMSRSPSLSPPTTICGAARNISRLLESPAPTTLLDVATPQHNKRIGDKLNNEEENKVKKRCTTSIGLLEQSSNEIAPKNVDGGFTIIRPFSCPVGHPGSPNTQTSSEELKEVKSNTEEKNNGFSKPHKASKEKKTYEIISDQGSSYHFVQKPVVVSRPEPTVLSTENLNATSNGCRASKPEPKSNYNILNSLLTNDDPPAFGSFPTSKDVTPALSRSLLISNAPHLWRTPSSSHICDNTGVRSAFVPVTSQKQLTRALSTEELGSSKQQPLPSAGSLKSLCDKENENNISMGNCKKMDKIQVDSQQNGNCSEQRGMSVNHMPQASSSSSSSSSTSTLCQSGDSVLCGSALTTPTPATSVPSEVVGGSSSAPATLSKASALVLVSSQPTVSSSITTSPSTVPSKRPGKNRFTPIRPKLENCFTTAPQKLPQSPLKKDMRPVHTLLQEQRVKTAQELLVSLASSHQSEVAVDPKGVIVSTTLSSSTVNIPGAPLARIFQAAPTSVTPGLSQPQILLSLPKGNSNPPLIILPSSSQTQPQGKPIVLQDAKGNKYTLEEEPAGTMLVQPDRGKPREENKDANVRSGSSLQVQVVGPDVHGQSYLLVPNSEAGAGVNTMRSKSVVPSESSSVSRQGCLNQRSVSMMLSPTSCSSISMSEGLSKSKVSENVVCKVKKLDNQLLKETDQKCGNQNQSQSVTLDKVLSKDTLPPSATLSAFQKCSPESGLVQSMHNKSSVDAAGHKSTSDAGNPINPALELTKVSNPSCIRMAESSNFVFNKEDDSVKQTHVSMSENKDISGNSRNGFAHEESNRKSKVSVTSQEGSFDVPNIINSKSEPKSTENSSVEISLQHALRKRKATSNDVDHGRKKRSGDSDPVTNIVEDDLQILEPYSEHIETKGNLSEKVSTPSVERRPTTAFASEECTLPHRTDTETLLNMLGDTKSMTVKQVVAALNKVRKQLDLGDRQGSANENMPSQPEIHHASSTGVSGHSKKVKRSRTRALSSPVTSDSSLSTTRLLIGKEHQRPSGRSASLNLESLEIDALLDLDHGIDTHLVDDSQDKEKTVERVAGPSDFAPMSIASKSRPDSALSLSLGSCQEKRPSSVSVMVCGADQGRQSLSDERDTSSQPFMKHTAERSRSCVQDILNSSVSCKRQDVAKHSSAVIGHMPKTTSKKISNASSHASHFLRTPKPLKASHQKDSISHDEYDKPVQTGSSFDSDLPTDVIDFITESMAGKSRTFVDNSFSSLLQDLGSDCPAADNCASGANSSFSKVKQSHNPWTTSNATNSKEQEIDVSNQKGFCSTGSNTLSSGTFLSPTGPARPVRRTSVERSLSSDRTTPKICGEQARPPSRLKLLADNPSELRCPTPVEQVVSIKQAKQAKRDSYIAKDQTTAIMLQQPVDHSRSTILDLPETCISGFVIHGTAETLRGDRALSETPVSDPGYSSVGQTPVSEVGGSVSASPAAMLLEEAPSSTFIPVRAASVTGQPINSEELNQPQTLESSVSQQGSQKESCQSTRTNLRMSLQGSDLSDRLKENSKRVLTSGHTHGDLLGFDKLLSVKLECMPTPPSSPTSLPNLQRDALKSPMAMNSSCKPNSSGSYCMAPPRPPSSACVQPRLSVMSTSPMITNQIDVTNLGNISRYSPRLSSSPHHQHQPYPHPSPPFTPVAVSMVSPRCGTPCGDSSAPNRFMPIQTSGILATSLASSHFPLYIQPIKPVVTLASAASVGLTQANYPATLPANTLPMEASANIVDRSLNLLRTPTDQPNTFQVSCPTLSKKTTSKKLAALGDTLPKSASHKSSIAKTAAQNVSSQSTVVLSMSDKTESGSSLAPGMLKFPQRRGWSVENLLTYQESLPTYQEAVSQIGSVNTNMDLGDTNPKVSTNKEHFTVSGNVAVQEHRTQSLPISSKLTQIISLDLEPQPSLAPFPIHCDLAKRSSNLGNIAAPTLQDSLGVSASLVDASETMNRSSETEQFDDLAETLDVLKTLDSHYFQHDEDSNLSSQ